MNEANGALTGEGTYPRRFRSPGHRTRLWRYLAMSMLASLFGWAPKGFSADFTVTTPGGAFAFTINGTQPNPTLTLVRGKTYTFAVNTSAVHPFFIQSSGAQSNNISQGTLTYTVPLAASNYAYVCSIHFFGGQIVTVAPPPSAPPPIQLLSLSVGTNLVLLSTGTNTWSVNPEYSTDLGSTNWFALSVQTNLFLNGTNETICGRPAGNSVFVRVRSQPQ